jgi:hypothetical protein
MTLKRMPEQSIPESDIPNVEARVYQKGIK